MKAIYHWVVMVVTTGTGIEMLELLTVFSLRALFRMFFKGLVIKVLFLEWCQGVELGPLYKPLDRATLNTANKWTSIQD